SAVNVEHNRRTKSPDRVAHFDSGAGYKPWWIAQHLVDPRNSSNMSTSHGLDNYLVSRARKMEKEIGGLESVDEHVAVLGGLSDRDSEILLRGAVGRPEPGQAEIDRMRKASPNWSTAALWRGHAPSRNE